MEEQSQNSVIKMNTLQYKLMKGRNAEIKEYYIDISKNWLRGNRLFCDLGHNKARLFKMLNYVYTEAYTRLGPKKSLFGFKYAND